MTPPSWKGQYAAMIYLAKVSPDLYTLSRKGDYLTLWQNAIGWFPPSMFHRLKMSEGKDDNH